MRRPGVGGARRSGYRGIGGSLLLAPSISISGGTLTATVTGVPTPTVQWQRYIAGAWANIAGATSTTYNDDDTGGLVSSVYDVRANATNAVATTTSNTLSAWTPLLLGSKLLEWWDANTLSNGAVASWAGQKGAATLVQGTGAAQPTKSATSIVAPDASTYPGVSFDGGDILSTADLGTAIDALGLVSVFAAVQDTQTGSTAKIIVEYTATWSSGTGGFFLAVNDGIAGCVEAGSRAGGNGNRRSLADAAPLTDPAVVAAPFSRVVTNGVTGLYLDGVVLDGTNPLNASGGGGTFASDSLHVGARSGGTLNWTGVLGQLVLTDGTETAAEFARTNAYLGVRVGVVTA
jgi:hypothetical protein